MSVFTTREFTCPDCGATLEYDNYDSINADRRPDLREEIISRSLSLVHCEACDKEFRPEPSLNYLDYKTGLWIMARPIYTLGHWDIEEQRATVLFANAYGTNAPKTAQEIGDALTPRLVFGWAALREKLVLKEAELDDLQIEKTKLTILANRPGNPIAPGVELRLINAREQAFRMAWLDATSGEALQQFDIQRALYDSMNEGDDWGEIEDTLKAGIFTDIQRMFIEPQPMEDSAG